MTVRLEDRQRLTPADVERAVGPHRALADDLCRPAVAPERAQVLAVEDVLRPDVGVERLEGVQVAWRVHGRTPDRAPGEEAERRGIRAPGRAGRSDPDPARAARGSPPRSPAAGRSGRRGAGRRSRSAGSSSVAGRRSRARRRPSHSVAGNARRAGGRATARSSAAASARAEPSPSEGAFSRSKPALPLRRGLEHQLTGEERREPALPEQLPPTQVRPGKNLPQSAGPSSSGLRSFRALEHVPRVETGQRGSARCPRGLPAAAPRAARTPSRARPAASAAPPLGIDVCAVQHRPGSVDRVHRREPAAHGLRRGRRGRSGGATRHSALRPSDVPSVGVIDIAGRRRCREIVASCGRRSITPPGDA